MNRKSFLRKLGIGLGVAVVAPQVFAEKDSITRYNVIREEPEIHGDGWYSRSFRSYRDPDTGNNIYVGKGILRQIEDSPNRPLYTNDYSQELWDDLIKGYKDVDIFKI